MNRIKINPPYDQIFFQKSPIRVMWKVGRLLYNRDERYPIPVLRIILGKPYTIKVEDRKAIVHVDKLIYTEERC